MKIEPANIRRYVFLNQLLDATRPLNSLLERIMIYARGCDQFADTILSTEISSIDKLGVQFPSYCNL